MMELFCGAGKRSFVAGDVFERAEIAMVDYMERMNSERAPVEGKKIM